MEQINADIAKSIRESQEAFSALRRLDPVLQVRSIMREKGLRNCDIAERLGVTEECVSRWLRGTANMQLDTLYKLADAAQVPLSIYFGELVDLKEVHRTDIGEEDPVEVEIVVSDVPNNVILLQKFSHMLSAAANDDGSYIEKEEKYEIVAAVA